MIAVPPTAVAALSPFTLDPDTCWGAITTRDPAYDGRFIVGVRTTGIYCRPTCRSRQPLRQNVAFYPDPDSARAAGFRACKRCQPDQPTDAGAEMIAAICRYIDQHAHTESITLTALAAQFHLSPHHLHRTFRRATRITPAAYVKDARARALRAALHGEGTVTEAIYASGYDSTSAVYNADTLGMTPTVYRQGAPGAMRAACVESPIGLLLVAMTARGVCAIKMGDDPAPLWDELQREFPAADITRDDDALRPTVEALIAYLRGDSPRLDLPLDIRATAFQRRVWEALRQIPYGETRSYSEVAMMIGSPTAARAVGGACADNDVAPIIPCHRVLPANGVSGHYRWGADRKTRLLDMEHGNKSAP